MKPILPKFRLPPILPGDAAYDSARRAWNAAHDHRPAAILRCSSATEVASAVRYAAERGGSLAVRGGGHSFPGYSGCDDGVVVDLGPLRDVQVDATRRLVTVGGGATWVHVDGATAAHDLAMPGGLVSTTGVGGLTLGGGIGWLSRAYGLACDQLVSAEVVLADGSVVLASAEEHPDLFWALRGGGGNFGIVTRFDFRLHPLPVGAEVLGGKVLYPAGEASSVLRQIARLGGDLPETVSLLCAFVSVPPLPFLPATLHFAPALAVALCDFSGDPQAEERVSPLRRLAEPLADLVQRLPYPAQQTLFDAGAPAGLRQYGAGANLRELSDAAIVVGTRQAVLRPTPLCQVHLHQLGGAVSRVAEDATAYAGRDAGWVVNIIATYTEPADDERCRAWVMETRRLLHDIESPRTYVNFLGEADAARVRAAYGAAKHDRLRAIKRRYDPANLFRLNANILPAD